MIPDKILLEKGGKLAKYGKSQVIFFEGSFPRFYYQIVEGTIKAISINANGKEFIQAMYKNGQSFGIPALITNKPYPVTALANETTDLIILSKPEFINILKEYPNINFEFIKDLGTLIYNCSLIAKAISNNNAEYKILTILKIQKQTDGSSDKKGFKINLSRQQIADMTGLRVETVIRTIKKMEKKSMLIIEKGKIYF